MSEPGNQSGLPQQAGTAQAGRPRYGRPVLGLLAHGADDPCSHMVWQGVSAVARERDANLICFPAKPLRSPLGFEAQANVLYNLINSSALDALVIWLAGMTLWVGVDEAQSVCDRYRPLPMVTAGGLLKGIPGVVVDNYHGMWEVVSHLIEAHGQRRIAFIRGPESHHEAEERFAAYCDVLAAHGIPFDATLVAPGNFKENGGTTAVAILLDERRVRFNALVAASDNMAIGAMKALQARGLRVPADVAIGGLNDEEESPFVTPPLTTSPLHFREQARHAAEMALDLLAGRAVPERVVLPTRLLVRQSCGCPDPLVTEAAAEVMILPSEPGTSLFSSAESWPADLAQALDLPAGLAGAELTRQVVGAFVGEMGADGARGSFLAALAEALRQTAVANDAPSRWHLAISALRRLALPHLASPALVKAENLWQQARVLIGETAQRAQAYQGLQTRTQARTLADINQALSAALDSSELAAELIQALPRLQIGSCYLSLYEDPHDPTGQARLMLAYDERGSEPHVVGRRFPAPQLVPPDLLPGHRRYSLVVEPLYFRLDQLGLVLFEADPEGEEVYEILRDQISGALKRAQLAAHNIELYDEAVQARTVAEEGRHLAEEASAVKSRFLATVSHELRTPLSLIVGTIEMLLRAEDQGEGLPDPYRRDLRSIRTSAQHLAHLIGDVLDLASSQAGELHLACEALDLHDFLDRVAMFGAPMARDKALGWREEIPPGLPPVWGDRTRLQQVVLNLVTNAVKFTEHGEILLQAEASDGAVTISVSDTGMGIPPEEQAAIFDEFRQSERSARRGYGGMGLGLAIARRLVELHGGNMGVRSSGAEGAGSTFYFTLPTMPVPALRAPEPLDRAHTVLLLTERSGAAAHVRDYLCCRGFEVEELALEEHPDWLTHIVEAPPGAVVLDFEPAAERGWELMQAVRLNPNTHDVPVLFYALSEQEDRGSVLALDYLAKPLEAADLLRALERQGLSVEQNRPPQTVLLADDDPGILELHTRVLVQQIPGCRVVQARDGREALAAMEHERPDLVLLDLMMPEIDGFGVLEQMRQRERTRNVPVIVLTAQILTGADMARLQQGVAAVLSKGLYNGEEVMVQVEAALAASKRLGSEGQRVVRQVMAYIHEHYAEALSREDLAQAFCLNERYLTRLFHQETGLTPMTYLTRYRIRQARGLLETGRLNVTEVALATGFSDSSYFSRVFQREVGTSPGAYQRGRRAAARV